MKYCKNCSAVLGDNDVFCSECGASVDIEDNSAQQTNQNAEYNQEFTQSSYTPDPNQSNSNYNGGYQQPAQQPTQNNNYNQPAGKSPGQIWMILSIVSFVCCGGVLAIPAFIFALLSNQSFNRGDIADAQQKANTAKILFFIALGITILFLVIGFATGIISGASDFYTY